MPKPDASRLADLGRLYDRLAPTMFRYAAMILASRSDAEDVVHKIFTRALGDRWTGIDDTDAYLRRAVRNECFDLLRRQRLRATEDVAPLLEAVSAGSPSRDEQVLVEQVMKVLSPEQREVVHLKVFEGHTLAEIAAICGVPMNTVASRYRYALNKMREALGPQ